MDRELGVVIAKSRWSPQVFIWENCIVDFYPKFDSRFIERTCSIQSTVLSITRFIWGAPCTVQQMQKRYYFGFFAKNWNEIVAARFPLSLSLTLTLSPGFSLFFVFSPFLSLLFAVIEGITDLFVVPAARYTVASLFRNKMDFAHSGNDRNQYCSSAFRMMMHRIQIFPDSLVRCWYSTFCMQLCAELLVPSAAATDSDKLLQKNSIRPML